MQWLLQEPLRTVLRSCLGSAHVWVHWALRCVGELCAPPTHGSPSPSPDGPTQWEGTYDSSPARWAPLPLSSCPKALGSPPQTQMPLSRLDSEGKSQPMARSHSQISSLFLLPSCPGKARSHFNHSFGSASAYSVSRPRAPHWGKRELWPTWLGQDSRSLGLLCWGPDAAGSVHRGPLWVLEPCYLHHLVLGAGDTVASVLARLPPACFQGGLPSGCSCLDPAGLPSWDPQACLPSVASVRPLPALRTCPALSSRCSRAMSWGVLAVLSGAGGWACCWRPLTAVGPPRALHPRPHSSDERPAAPGVGRGTARSSPSLSRGLARLSVWALLTRVQPWVGFG